MNNPKISVIIPIYNVEKYLSECLDSIVNQTLKEIEIICVNDGSTDNSLSILKEYASKDERIKIIDKENEGQGYARKVGLDIANGEYILFCDSDDYYSELTVFKELYCEVNRNKSELMFFRFIYGNRKSTLFDDYKSIDSSNKNKFIFDLYFAPWFKIYKKSFLDRYESWCFPKYLKYQDTPFHIQSVIRTESISFFDKICYYYREDNPTNVTNSKIGKKHIENICEIIILIYNILEEEKVLEKYSLEFSYFAVNRLKAYFNCTGQRTDLIFIIKGVFDKISFVINKALKNYSIIKTCNFPYLDISRIIFYKSFVRLDLENLCRYVEGKKIKELIYLSNRLRLKNEQLGLNNKLIVKRDEYIRNIETVINQKDSEIQNLHTQNNIQDLAIKRLQNSWSYRIGRLFTYPLSLPLDFLKFILDYNLIKKSDLFDSEYYLSQNEDVKKAKMNPIKHYLKFGWKEGRNPSAEFNGNEYLNKRPDVQVTGICPLVHYIRFGRNS